ncbi:MAG: hypothetical protein HUU14_05895 [Dehalococcoidia bacterium]|nr:hypothetical protein [Dehalococcoidia bacterium]
MAPLRIAGLALGVVTLVLAFAACGDDDGGDHGTDASYADELCDAMNETNVSLVKLEKDASSMDFNELAGGVSEILDDLADSLADASPPADMAAWNEDAVKTIRKAADTLTKSQQSASLDVLGDSPLPDPPTALRSRIEAEAGQIPACRGLSLFGE